MPWPSLTQPVLSRQHVFPLPLPILASCTLAPEVMEKYLDPWYMPPQQAGSATSLRSNAAAYRVKALGQQVPTIMAQYTQQHLLPEPLLARKGLFGPLLRDETGHIRFFSGPEVCALHGAVLPQWLDEDTRAQYTALGNAIAPAHAVFALAHAVQLLPISGPLPEPTAAVHLARRLAFTSRNTLLVPASDGCFLCRTDQLTQVLACITKNAKPASYPAEWCDPPHMLVLSSPTDTATVHFSPTLDIGQVTAALGGTMLHELATPARQTAWLVELQCEALPCLHPHGFVHGTSPAGRVLLLLSPQGCFCLHDRRVQNPGRSKVSPRPGCPARSPEESRHSHRSVSCAQ